MRSTRDYGSSTAGLDCRLGHLVSCSAQAVDDHVSALLESESARASHLNLVPHLVRQLIYSRPIPLPFPLASPSCLVCPPVYTSNQSSTHKFTRSYIKRSIRSSAFLPVRRHVHPTFLFDASILLRHYSPSPPYLTAVASKRFNVLSFLFAT